MFEVGRYYRHRNTLDTDIKVLLVQWDDEKEVGLKIRYIDRRSGGIYYRRIPGDMDEYVAILKKDFQNWKEVPRVQ